MNKQLLSELNKNVKKLYHIVNNLFDIKELMGESRDKGVYCPFHGESRTSGSKPSARFYTNQTPTKLWCFRERKSFYSYHYIKMVLKQDPLQYLIENSTERAIKYWADDYDETYQDEENEENPYMFFSLDDINNLYSTLDIKEDYTNWYLV